jgi:hypothetical protein
MLVTSICYESWNCFENSIEDEDSGDITEEVIGKVEEQILILLASFKWLAGFCRDK